MEYIKFKQQEPPLNHNIELLLGGGHKTFAVYLGNSDFLCKETHSEIKLNINDFDAETKNVLAWRLI